MLRIFFHGETCDTLRWRLDDLAAVIDYEQSCRVLVLKCVLVLAITWRIRIISGRDCVFATDLAI